MFVSFFFNSGPVSCYLGLEVCKIVEISPRIENPGEGLKVVVDIVPVRMMDIGVRSGE